MIIAAILLMLILSAFFSGSEIAYISADRLRIALQEEEGSARGRILMGLFENQSRFLGTMLVGNNIVLVIFGNLIETAFTPWLNRWLPEFLRGDFGLLLSITLLSTVVVLLFGEFIPKILFRSFATQLLVFFTYLYQGLSILLYPFVMIMVKSSEWLLTYLFKVDIPTDQPLFTRVDLKDLVRSGATENALDETMFENAMGFKKKTVSDCMIPRQEIEAISTRASIEELRQCFINTGFSRILVYDTDIDHIKGYIHHLKLLDEPRTIAEARFDIACVAPDLPVIDLMNTFIHSKTSIACVQEGGHTLGMITMEDILEEVFGEIEDEHDV